MANHSSKVKERVSAITLHYRRLQTGSNQPATLRAFAAWLSAALAPHHRHISHQSIKNWSDKRYIPDRSLMKQIAEEALHDWRGEFAREILAAIEMDIPTTGRKSAPRIFISPNPPRPLSELACAPQSSDIE